MKEIQERIKFYSVFNNENTNGIILGLKEAQEIYSKKIDEIIEKLDKEVKKSYWEQDFESIFKKLEELK